MNKVLNQICLAYETGYDAADAADKMYDIARAELARTAKLECENTFARMGRFLLDNAERLEKDFDSDRSYGRAAVIPNISSYIWAKFWEHNRIIDAGKD